MKTHFKDISTPISTPDLRKIIQSKILKSGLVHGFGSSNCTLWRFRRNVVSPLGSFLSFIASFVYNLPGFYIFLTATPVGPSVIGELHSFSFHCFYFFCLNFIESLCSPTLRGTLVNLLPWFRHEYQAVVV